MIYHKFWYLSKLKNTYHKNLNLYLFDRLVLDWSITSKLILKEECVMSLLDSCGLG